MTSSSISATCPKRWKRFIGCVFLVLGSASLFRTSRRKTSQHELELYSTARFRQRQATIVFQPSLLNKLVHRLANRFVVPYEERWAWIFPAWFLYFELETLKASGAQGLLPDRDDILAFWNWREREPSDHHCY